MQIPKPVPENALFKYMIINMIENPSSASNKHDPFNMTKLTKTMKDLKFKIRCARLKAQLVQFTTYPLPQLALGNTFEKQTVI